MYSLNKSVILPKKLINDEIKLELMFQGSILSITTSMCITLAMFVLNQKLFALIFS